MNHIPIKVSISWCQWQAVELLSSQEASTDDTSLDAFLSLARFADGQYQNISNYMKSSTYEDKRDLVKKARCDAEKLKDIGEKSR